MSKLTIIQLLNKIANGDIELGTKFNWHYKWHDIELIFTERQAALGLYFQQEDRLIGLFERFNYQILNDEVEIIEEDKGIKKITVRAGLVGDIDNKLENLDINIMAVEDKINESIDKVNSLENKK